MENLIKKLFKEEFYIEERSRLTKREQLALNRCMENDLIDTYEEYLNEEDGWQLFSDMMGNIDIWESGKIVHTLYIKDGQYYEPNNFIVKLIDFMEKNSIN